MDCRPARDPAQHVSDAIWASEGCTLARQHIELSKAMEQITASDLTQFMSNGVI